MRWHFIYYVQISTLPYAEMRMITLDPEMYDDSIQYAVEALYADPSVMRVYKLEQYYSVGKRRGE